MSSRKERTRAKKHGDRLRREARKALEAGDASLAKRILARALEGGAGNARYWMEQGEVLLALGEDDAAESSLREALTLSPDYPAAIELLARLLRERGERERASELLARLEPEPLASSPRDGDWSIPALAAPARTAGVDWDAVETMLITHGAARLASQLSEAECVAWSSGPRMHARSGAGELRRSSCTVLESTAMDRDPLIDELVGMLAGVASHAHARLGRKHVAASAHEFLPDRSPIARHCSLALGEPIELPIPAARPRFPFALVCVLAAAPLAARLQLRLVDVRPGKKEHSYPLDAGAGDIVIACARERWVPVGGVFGLLPILRRFEAVGGSLAVLDLSF